MGLLVVVVFAVASAFAAERLLGRVVKITDGDTITGLDAPSIGAANTVCPRE